MSRGPLRFRAFRLLFAAQSVSSFGDRLVPVALAFAVLELTGSVTDLGIVLACQTVPLMAFVLFGGQAISGPIAAAIGLSTTLLGAAGLALVLLAAGLAASPVRNFRAP